MVLRLSSEFERHRPADRACIGCFLTRLVTDSIIQHRRARIVLNKQVRPHSGVQARDYRTELACYKPAASRHIPCIFKTAERTPNDPSRQSTVRSLRSSPKARALSTRQTHVRRRLGEPRHPTVTQAPIQSEHRQGSQTERQDCEQGAVGAEGGAELRSKEC